LHELEEICDAAAILDHGNVVATGTMEDLTSAAKEFRVQVLKGPLPLDKIHAIEGVSRASYERKGHLLTVHCDEYGGAAEDIINQVLMVLLQDGIKISAVSKGKGLEQRVMELTE
jgi:ABC-type multidrug transport system ATPase subunit